MEQLVGFGGIGEFHILPVVLQDRLLILGRYRYHTKQHDLAQVAGNLEVIGRLGAILDGVDPVLEDVCRSRLL